jgi:hypothetical protein
MIIDLPESFAAAMYRNRFRFGPLGEQTLRHPLLYAAKDRDYEADLKCSFYNGALWFVVENMEAGVQLEGNDEWLLNLILVVQAIYDGDYETAMSYTYK